MQALALVASAAAFLVRTQTLPDPNNSSAQITSSFSCDLKGNPLVLGAAPLPIYRDLYSTRTFVRVAEKIPTGTSSADVAAASAIRALSPIHFVSPDGHVNGWFIEAPDFNGREGK